MRLRLVVPLLSTGLGMAAAQAPADCALARMLDAASYATLTMRYSSEADQDAAAYDWAECRAAALGASLSAQPQLRARIASLRKQLREMRALESELAGQRAGGGTMYGHAVPRSFAPLEERLSSLANLARSSAGAVRSVRYEAAVRDARDQHAAYLKALRAYQPKPGETYVPFDRKEWTANVNRYQALGKSVMQTLSSRGDAATALGYSLLNDWTFFADE